MEEKKYTMADLLAEFGDGFDKMEDPEEEKIEEVVEEQPKIEVKPEPVLKDQTIKCKKCEGEFVWTVRDQEFYKEKGFFRPSICKNCRKKMKVVNNFHKEA